MIPLFSPSVTQLEIDAVTEVLQSHWWGLGEKTEEFEKKFAEFVGAKYAVGLSNATIALDLAVKAEIGINTDPNAEIIVPAFTFVSTGLAALYNNYKVVFADIDEETLCIDWLDVAQKINVNTKAVIPVHYAGRNATTPLSSVRIIEDCAHAVGNPTVASNTSCWSFHVVKNLATGDGGMITTNDEEVYKKLLPLRWVGIDKSTHQRMKGTGYTWDYNIETIGYKAHMNDITAALGLAQLSRIKEMNGRRKIFVAEYILALRSIEWIRLPKFDLDSSWHMFVIRVDKSIRNKFIDYMKEHGVTTGVHYKPLYTYSIFPQTPLPVTEKVWQEIVTLPLFPDMTDDQFEMIVSTIKRFKP